LQIAIALLTAFLGSIPFDDPPPTLRWTLWYEGRNAHNSNLCLFTKSKRNGQNKWPANLLAWIGLILADGDTEESEHGETAR
jgi:hypothetical protein